jgi:hypothetical protein
MNQSDPLRTSKSNILWASAKEWPRQLPVSNTRLRICGSKN